MMTIVQDISAATTAEGKAICGFAAGAGEAPMFGALRRFSCCLSNMMTPLYPILSGDRYEY